MKFGLKRKTIEQIKSVFANYPQIEKAIVYGSRAKNNFKNGSDIDLTLTGSELNHSMINKISLDIDDLLLPYSFDISIFKQISNPDLVDHIKRVGVVFYEKVVKHDVLTIHETGKDILGEGTNCDFFGEDYQQEQGVKVNNSVLL